MSRVAEVIKAKNRTEKEEKKRRQLELTNIKQKTSFKYRILRELENLDSILDEDEDAKLEIEIPDKYMTLFSNILYEPEMSVYRISQSNKTNTFIIEKRFIQY